MVFCNIKVPSASSYSVGTMQKKLSPETLRRYISTLPECGSNPNCIECEIQRKPKALRHPLPGFCRRRARRLPATDAGAREEDAHRQTSHQLARSWRGMRVCERTAAVANIFCPNRKWALRGGWLPPADPVHRQIKRGGRPLPTLPI